MRRISLMTVAVVMATACSLGGPPEDASGEEIYADLCANCHSADLTGAVGPSLAAGSNAASEDDEYLRFTVMNGRGRMPSFSSSLDEAQLDRLVVYIREVQDG